MPLFTKQYNLVPCELVGFICFGAACSCRVWAQWSKGYCWSSPAVILDYEVPLYKLSKLYRLLFYPLTRILTLSLNLTLNLILTFSYLTNKHRYAQRDVSIDWMTSSFVLLYDSYALWLQGYMINQLLNVTGSVHLGYRATLYRDIVFYFTDLSLSGVTFTIKIY